MGEDNFISLMMLFIFKCKNVTDALKSDVVKIENSLTNKNLFSVPGRKPLVFLFFTKFLFISNKKICSRKV